MNRVPSIATRFAVNAVALAGAAWLLPGIQVDSIRSLVVAAVVFGLVNVLVRPVLTTLSCPFIVLTLGLFLLVINAAMLGLTAWVSGQIDGGFRIDTLPTALVGALIVSLISWTLSQFAG